MFVKRKYQEYYKPIMFTFFSNKFNTEALFNEEKSHTELFSKKGVLKYFAKFILKQACSLQIYFKKAPTQMFSCISRDTFFWNTCFI